MSEKNLEWDETPKQTNLLKNYLAKFKSNSWGKEFKFIQMKGLVFFFKGDKIMIY